MSRQNSAARISDGGARDFTPLGLVIKAHLGDDVRRIPILNEDLTYDELMLMMQRVFRGKLSGSDEVLIKYTDEDGDLVTIADGSDLHFAIQCCRGVLNLTLIVNGKALLPENNEIRHIRQELQSLRKHVDCLLDVLPLISSNRPPSSLQTDAKTPRATAAADRSNLTNSAVSQPTAVLSPTSGREFDPLSAALQQQQQQQQQQHPSSMVDENVQQKVLSSFGLAAVSTPADVVNMRSGTPDSMSSVGSAHSSRQMYQPPVQTGYSQSQAAYNQAQAGHSVAQSAPVPGYGQMAGPYVGSMQLQGSGPQPPVGQQQQQQFNQQQYNQQQQQQLPSPGGPPRPGTNPYASGLHYGGHYPRPSGQFPQAS